MSPSFGERSTRIRASGNLAGTGTMGHEFQSAGVGLKAGATLGRYSIVEALGSGGMGVVYRARDERLERDVALKILAPGLLAGDTARRRLRTEALALAKLGHAHIAAVYDAGEQDGFDYVVMECVEGETLAARIADGPITVKDATKIVLQIAEALDEAHEHGVVHRDLKPANVMITPKGQVKVLDFGLAKLLAPETDETRSQLGTQGILGTPVYMSPEQALGKELDGRTDLWSLGVIYYELLTGRAPFKANSAVAMLRAIVDDAPTPVRELRGDAPAEAAAIVARAMQKDRAKRYQTAAEMVGDLSDLLLRLSATFVAPVERTRRMLPLLVVGFLVVALAAGGGWAYRVWSGRNWARTQAIPQMNALLTQRQGLAAYHLLLKAQHILPADAALKQFAADNTTLISVTSSPAGAKVEIKDYATPSAPWEVLGTTPLQQIQVPKGYFRWRVTKAGLGESITAPQTDTEMNFPLEEAHAAPAGMVYVPADTWQQLIAFIGWIGPYKLPAYYMDKYEVTNKEYQRFVDAGGYEKQQYWPKHMTEEGKEIAWSEAMARFRDTTERPGPAGWAGGHYPEGKADFPVTGVSWFEASAYAAFAGKQLPVLPQWYQVAGQDVSEETIPASNISGKALAAAGSFNGLGLFGTYDLAGNAREWVETPVDEGHRYILGGSWRSANYLYNEPEALSPFDRSDANGFRCVKNLGELPANALLAVKHSERDFSKFKPASDETFHAYEALYADSGVPLNATSGGVVKETVDWREEKVTLDTGYGGERMAMYLFLPKNVKPPYQTVLFFPSARVDFLSTNNNGRDLGDLSFFDYVVQSGRAVAYPIYQDTYERRLKYSLPGGAQSIELTTEWYKDAARALNYLGTRKDIDSTRLAYLGVSMGAAEGVIAGPLLQDRLKAMILLDGGYFMETPPPGGDQADFAPRMKKPVLMVNGRYDYVFDLETTQNPLFRMLGTPEQDKRHVVLETPHDVTEDRPQLVKVVLEWLDKYLGRVGE